MRMVYAYPDKQEVEKLFCEYKEMLIAHDRSTMKCLHVQGFDEELEHFDLKYGLPDGRLYLAYVGEKVAGCIGLKKFDDITCEMKRLYVRPAFRGYQVGRNLVNKIIQDAKDMGYQCMLLDTLPWLKSAIRIYKAFGFYEVERYNDNPMATAIYMKLDLDTQLHE